MPENIDLKYFKYLAIYSLILGVICALMSLFHSLMPFFTLFFIPFLGSPIPLLILILKDRFYSKENKIYLIFGALSGFCIWLGFAVFFIILVHICTLINKEYYDYGIRYLNLFLTALFFIMISTVYISTNAVVGLLTGIVYKFIKGEKNV